MAWAPSYSYQRSPYRCWTHVSQQYRRAQQSAFAFVLKKESNKHKHDASRRCGLYAHGTSQLSLAPPSSQDLKSKVSMQFTKNYSVIDHYTVSIIVNGYGHHFSSQSRRGVSETRQVRRNNACRGLGFTSKCLSRRHQDAARGR